MQSAHRFVKQETIGKYNVLLCVVCFPSFLFPLYHLSPSCTFSHDAGEGQDHDHIVSGQTPQEHSGDAEEDDHGTGIGHELPSCLASGCRRVVRRERLYMSAHPRDDEVRFLRLFRVAYSHGGIHTWRGGVQKRGRGWRETPRCILVTKESSDKLLKPGVTCYDAASLVPCQNPLPSESAPHLNNYPIKQLAYRRMFAL